MEKVSLPPFAYAPLFHLYERLPHCLLLIFWIAGFEPRLLLLDLTLSLCTSLLPAPSLFPPQRRSSVGTFHPSTLLMIKVSTLVLVRCSTLPVKAVDTSGGEHCKEYGIDLYDLDLHICVSLLYVNPN